MLGKITKATKKKTTFTGGKNIFRAFRANTELLECLLHSNRRKINLYKNDILPTCRAKCLKSYMPFLDSKLFVWGFCDACKQELCIHIYRKVSGTKTNFPSVQTITFLFYLLNVEPSKTFTPHLAELAFYIANLPRSESIICNGALLSSMN